MSMEGLASNSEGVMPWITTVRPSSRACGFTSTWNALPSSIRLPCMWRAPMEMMSSRRPSRPVSSVSSTVNRSSGIGRSPPGGPQPSFSLLHATRPMPTPQMMKDL
jgi:hypothetical protein